MSSIDQLLEEARRGWARLEPAQAAEAIRDGALLIDTRPAAQRELEWRLDPTSPHRIPQITDHAQTVIVICNEGYSSSLAAATLHRLGLPRATDVIGGFQAWVSCGLPVCGRRPRCSPADLS
jgi:rhodanese-related sulfurtransferase